MEGALSGDVSASGDATLHRFLVSATQFTRVLNLLVKLP